MCRGANSSRSNATATTTSPKKLISVLSVFIAMILTYLDKCTRILLNLISKGPYSSSESEIKFRRCLFTFFIKLKRRTCAKTAKKCTKKRDARAKLLFCLWNLVFFLHVLVAVALLNLKVPNILSPVPLTVPEIFAKVNSTQIPSRF